MFTTIQSGKTRNIRADYIQDILIRRKFYSMAMDLTKEQLDAVEAVKGKRIPGLWDVRCQQYLDSKNKSITKKTVKVDSTS